MPRTRRMRDMARRRMDMARRRRDYARGRRDYRNPYGSEGGYVVSRRTGRDMLMMDDMRRYRENPEMYDLAEMTRQNRKIQHDPYTPYMDGRNYDYVPTYNGNPVESDGHYPYMMDYGYDYARNRRTGRYMKDYGRYGYDYADGEEYLDDEELMEWSKDLLKEIDPQFKPQFERNRVIQRAKEMGVDFKDFTEDEFYVTALMIATDFGKTIGMNNTDQMFRMAYDWLNDEDAELQGSEKLATYYDEIVCAE